MTLDEAVTYFTEEAELRKRMSQLDGSFVTEARNEQAKRIHTEAAKNNKQLAEWLMELKELRSLLNTINKLEQERLKFKEERDKYIKQNNELTTEIANFYHKVADVIGSDEE